MQLRSLLQTDAEERAVSPVIGVILMVAITVILAAVIASFVLGLGDSQEVTPTATYDFSYNPGGTPTVDITHTGGDSVRVDELYIRGDTANGTTDGQWDQFSSATVSGEVEGQSAVVSGDTVRVQVSDSSYVIRVVWESTAGDSSSELASDRGPDA